jgi:YHS domain-containing protein
MIAQPSRYRLIAPALSILLGALLAAMTPALVVATEPDSDAIAWRVDYAGALEEARAANRLLWIQFTGPWCPNCTRMERDSFPDPAIIQHARRSFVPLKLRSDVHEQLALSFDLSALPATVILAPTRQVVAIRQGYLAREELDGLLSEVLAAYRGPARETGPRPRESAPARTHSNRPKSEPQLALSGYCPVSLIADRRLVPGQAEYTVQHEGRVYRFASSVMSSLFRKDPERYIPVNRGECPVAQVEGQGARSGDPRWGVLYQGRLFLCATQEARQRFLNDPQRYALVDVAEQGFCPHCLGGSGLLVRGDPQYAITREGRRYWFPDPSHRDAFLTAGATTVRR